MCYLIDLYKNNFAQKCVFLVNRDREVKVETGVMVGVMWWWSVK